MICSKGSTVKHNEILDGIYRVGEQIAVEAGEDSKQPLVRAEEAKARARGVKFSPAPEPAEPSAVVREEPPEE
jgi:hypothetical protein